jgi:hypothetical protein
MTRSQSVSRHLSTLLAGLALPVLLSASAVWSHPHFFREVQFSFQARNPEDSTVLKIQHITVPYNEIKATELPVGETWHCGFATFTTPLDLKIGTTNLSAGEYKVQVLHAADKAWEMQLTQGEGDKAMVLKLDAEYTPDSGIDQSHLAFDFEIEGEHDEAKVYVVLRFGPQEIKFPVQLADN